MNGRRLTLVLGALGTTGCAGQPGATPPGPRDTVVVVDTVRTGEGNVDALRQQVAALQLRMLERDAQLDELRRHLDETRREVVRAMAKLQTSASRAEAASAMAEAEVAIRQLQHAGRDATGELSQATRLLDLGNAEFEQENYGGALYLATEAKNVASAGRRRVGNGGGGLRPGEVRFAVPLRLQTTTRSNVRDGPGTAFRVLATLEAGTQLTGESYVDQWVRVTDPDGRSGWIFHTLVEARR